MSEELEERTVEMAVNDFYKLKEKYEKENTEIKKKIIDNPSLSWKEKRNEYQKIKPKCINCKRPGGTLFFCKFREEDDREFRQLKAICGITVEPCNLNITINVGKYIYFSDGLKDYEQEIAKIKKDIIEYKNKLLFGYMTTNEALVKFDNLKSLLSDYTTYSQSFLEEYLHIIDNTKQKQKLQQEIEQSYNFINQIKKCIADFNETTDTQFVRDAIEIYDTNLKPILNKIINDKYKVNFVWYNDKTYYLIQEKHSIKELEINEGTEEIVSYNIGFSDVRQKSSRNSNINLSSQLQSEPSEPSEGGFKGKMNLLQNRKNKLLSEEVSPKDNSTPEIVLEYTLNPDGTILWKNYEYEKVWNTFNQNLKNALVKDKEWLNVFITSCYHNQEMGEPCKFVSPTNLIIPPQIIHLQNGYLYDFGNESYNNYFNELEKTERDSLLKSFTINDGVKKYNILEENLANELSKIYGLST
jgi:hypothetical protein